MNCQKTRMIMLASLLLLASTSVQVAEGAITGQGTAGRIVKFKSATEIEDSEIFESGNNIGIGTTSPGDILHISAPSITYVRVDRTSTGSYSGIKFCEGTTEQGRINLMGSTFTTTARRNDLELYTTNGGDVTIQPFTGNVGIATCSPSKSLHVAGTGILVESVSPPFYFRETDGSANQNWKVAVENGDLYFQTANDALAVLSTRVSFDFGGNVGIGTTSPVYDFDVQGGQHSTVRTYGSGNPYFRAESSDNGVVTKLQSVGGSSLGMVGTDSNHKFAICTNNQYRMYFDTTGNVGIGTSTPDRKLTVRGNILVEDSSGNDVVELGTGLDYSEGFQVSDREGMTPGSVVVIDVDNPGKLTISAQPYDTKVAGIVAGAKGLGSGVKLGVDGFDCDVALAGRVYCNVDATEAAIEPGDLLTTSRTPGYAMKPVDYTLAQGAILGKAMQRLEQGKKDQILVLVTLQ